jgi:preprotein translocase subunit Sec61beta
MSQPQGMSQPSPFGGLMRYDEEFTSKFMLNPSHVIIGIVVILIIVIGLKVFFPAVILGDVVPTSGSVPIGNSLWMSFFG